MAQRGRMDELASESLDTVGFRQGIFGLYAFRDDERGLVVVERRGHDFPQRSMKCPRRGDRHGKAHWQARMPSVRCAGSTAAATSQAKQRRDRLTDGGRSLGP